MAADPIETIEAVLVDATTEIRSGFTERGHIDEENPSGERQLEADVFADRLLADRFGDLDAVGAFASEERDSILDVGSGFSVTVDPLDGSSNLGSNNPVGTIVGVYNQELPANGATLEAAWFVLYGPLTTMVGTRGDSATETVIHAGEEIRTHAIELPPSPTVFGFGGRKPDWPQDFAAYAAEIADELKLRYGGAMVADVNQVLTHGGIFAYPALQSRPAGKLRLQFEAIPMAAIVEAAGGASSDGVQSLLAVEPTDLHQRTPVHVGNTSLVERLERALA